MNRLDSAMFKIFLLPQLEHPSLLLAVRRPGQAEVSIDAAAVDGYVVLAQEPSE